MKEENSIKVFVFVLKTIISFDKKYVIIILFSSIVLGLTPPIMTFLYQQVINYLQLRISLSNIVKYVVAYIIIIFLYNNFNLFLGYYKKKFSMDFDLYLNKLLLDRISRLNLQDIEDSETHDTLSMIKTQGASILLQFLETPVNILSGIISLVSYSVIIITYKPWLICFIVLPSILTFIVNKKMGLKEFTTFKKRASDLRIAMYYKNIMMDYNYFKELKLNNLYEHFKCIFDKFQNRFNDDVITINRKRVYLNFFVNIFEFIMDGFILSTIVIDGFYKTILTGTVFANIQSSVQIKEYLDVILEHLAEMQKRSLYIDQLITFLMKDDYSDSTEEGIVIDDVYSIEFKNLSFKYNNSPHYALENINFVLKKGESIAIVGRNGSGKTTLSKIIMGFYTNYEGEVLINGVELRQLNLRKWQDSISAIFQDYVKYEATLRENLSYSNLVMLDKDHKLLQIINKVGLNRMLDVSGINLDTYIGCLFNDGRQISIGQWQKIALGRSLTRNASIYIFDEPNSSQDKIAEKNIFDLIKILIREKISILITHRVSDLPDNISDILVLQEGKVSGRGTHNELINNSLEYKTLFFEENF